MCSTTGTSTLTGLAPLVHDYPGMRKPILIVLILSFASCASSTKPSVEAAPTSPQVRPVPLREVYAMADALISVANRPGFSVRALIQALEANNTVDTCRALGLAPTPCQELAARAYRLAERLEAAGGAVVGEASARGCTADYRLCLVAGFTASIRLFYRHPTLIFGAMTLAALKCRCYHCPRGGIGWICRAIPGL